MFVQLSLTATGAQALSAHLCHDEVGLHVHHNATDKYIFSPWTACNDNVFVNSDVLEVFLAPVKQPYDVPQYYHEIGPCMTRASCSVAAWPCAV